MLRKGRYFFPTELKKRPRMELCGLIDEGRIEDGTLNEELDSRGIFLKLETPQKNQDNNCEKNDNRNSSSGN